MQFYQEEKKFSKFLSVIIPVYNVESYIHKCLDSLVNQCDESVEIICIDDGSKDDSGNICEVYAKKNSNIFVFHKPNGGVSSARNLGLQKATGQYIAWVDPDDYVTPDWFITIKKTLQKYRPDCLLVDAYVESFRKTAQVHANLPLKMSSERFIYELSSERHIQSWLPLKIIKKECFVGLAFDENAVILEDYKLLTRLALRLRIIISISNCLYHYVRRSDSLSNDANIQKRLVAAQIAYDRYSLFKICGYKVSKASYWKMALLVCLIDNSREGKIYNDFKHQIKKYQNEIKRDFFKIIKSKEVGLKMKAATCLHILFPMKISSTLWRWVREGRYH